MKYIYLFIISIFTLSGCIKENEVFTPNIDGGLKENLLGKIDDHIFTREISLANANQLVTPNKKIINISLNSFADGQGQLYSGNAKVFIAEINSSAQFINRDIDTKIGEKRFQANNLFYFSAKTFDQKELFIKAPLETLINANVDELETELKLFFLQNGTNTWIEIQDNGTQRAIEPAKWEYEEEGGTIFGQGYKISAFGNGYYAIGWYLPIEEMVSLCIELPLVFNQNNTKVVFIKKDKISIHSLQRQDQQNGQFCSQVLLPKEGGSYNIITLSSTEDGKYFIGNLLNPKIGPTPIPITPVETSIFDINRLLKEL